MTQLTELGRLQCWWDHVRIVHVSPRDNRNLNPRFPVALGRVDMQLVGHLRWLVLCLMFISEMGAYQFSRHESLSILRSEGASVCRNAQ
jgi:hypothetical protein